jgi:hypothetical protein
MCHKAVFAQWTNWCQLNGVLPNIEMEMIESCNISAFQAAACHIRDMLFLLAQFYD